MLISLEIEEIRVMGSNLDKRKDFKIKVYGLNPSFLPSIKGINRMCKVQGYYIVEEYILKYSNEVLSEFYQLHGRKIIEAKKHPDYYDRV